MEASSRDARRRRIADRGSDRLALITGRIPTIPSSVSESSHSHTASCPPLISHDFHSDLQSDPVITPHSEDKVPKFDPLSDSGQPNAPPDGGRTSQPVLRKLQPLLRKCETSSETSSRAATVWESSNSAAQPVSPPPPPPLSAFQSSSIAAAASEREHPQQVQTPQPKFLTPKQLNTAIAVSEKIRTRCSLAFAILVLLSYVGFPILGSRIIKSIVLSRPLYLLLLTNISIVAALILADKQRGMGVATPGTSNVVVPPVVGEQGVFEQVGNVLELGMLMQKVMGAIFMDCSVYATAVICGLSLVQKLGW